MIGKYPRWTANAYDLTNIVLTKSCSDLTVLTGPENSFTTISRLKGIEKALSDKGLTLKTEKVFKNLNSTADTIQLLKGLFKGENPPKSIIFTDPKIVKAIIQACFEEHLEINKDILLAGFTSSSLLNTYRTKIPCVIQNTAKQSNILANYILKMLKQNPIQNKKEIIIIDAHILEE